MTRQTTVLFVYVILPCDIVKKEYDLSSRAIDDVYIRQIKCVVSSVFIARLIFQSERGGKNDEP